MQGDWAVVDEQPAPADAAPQQDTATPPEPPTLQPAPEAAQAAPEPPVLQPAPQEPPAPDVPTQEPAAPPQEAPAASAPASDAELQAMLSEAAARVPDTAAAAPAQEAMPFVKPTDTGMTERQKARVEREKSRNATGVKPPDEKRDSILEYLARHNVGLSLKEGEAQGLDPSQLLGKDTRVGISRAFRKDGMSFDDAAQMLQEAGYPTADAQGNYDPNVLLDLIDKELRGTKTFSNKNTDWMEQQAKAHEEQARAQEEEYQSRMKQLKLDAEKDFLDSSDPEANQWTALAAEATQYAGEDAVQTILEGQDDDADAHDSSPQHERDSSEYGVPPDR
jgi:DNA-binding transcriptional MerR regulator